MVMFMEFVLITLIVLSICVFLTFRIMNYFGLRLGVGALILCALCALLINFVLPSVTLYTTNYYFVFFLGFILLSASLITFYNERFSSLESGNQSSVLVGEALENLPRLHPTLNAAGSLLLISAKLPELPARPHMYAPVTPKRALVLPFTPTIQTAYTEVTPMALGKEANSYRLPVLITPTIHERAERDMMRKSRRNQIRSQINLISMDALIEYAYGQKDANVFENALFAFKCALDRYRNDDYAPFITIEIGNIYKNTGLYDEAIVIYNKAFYLRAVMASYELKKEFRNMIYYLHILKIILRNHHCLATPFDQIPSTIMQEIENEFQLWLSQKYAS